MNTEIDSYIPFIYGLIIAFIIRTIITSISSTIEEQVKRVIKWGPKKLWISISGFRVLHRRSIKLYKEAIKQPYSKIRNPFMRQILILQEIYVPLRLFNSPLSEKIDPRKAIREYNRIMIIGEPGSGKSTLLKHLFHFYINDLSEFSKSLFPIFLELSTLTNSTNKDLFDDLLSILDTYKFSNGRKFLERSLNDGDLILFMDGLDEMNNKKRRDIIVPKIKKFADKYTKIHLVVTCRSEVYKDDLSDIVDQTLATVKFDDKQISQLLTNWKKDFHQNESIDPILKKLHNTPRMMELAKNPLMLTIIAWLYFNENQELPHSRAKFYKKSCDILLRDWKPENNYNSAASKKAVLKHLALFIQDNSKEGNLKTIDFETAMEEAGKILSSINKNTEAESFLQDIVERSGLLIRIDGGYAYQFAHLSFQEYFAAEAIGNKPQNLLKRFDDSRDTWHETVKLWCGFDDYDCTSLIEELQERDPTLAFECLAEAVEIKKKSVAYGIIKEFETKFLEEPPSENIQRIFGSVASNIKSEIGSKAFMFLVTTLENKDIDSNIRQAAAYSLSNTNLPQAVRTLARNFFTFKGCKTALIEMGDFVFAVLKNEPDDVNPIQCIKIFMNLRTPLAAKAIVPYLWNGSNDTVFIAAWSLSSLLKLQNIEKELKNCPTYQKDENKNYNWIRFPFEDSLSSNLSKIYGRIGFIFNTYDIPDSLETITMDERISIPLFISNLNDADYQSIQNLLDEYHSYVVTYPRSIDSILDDYREDEPRKQSKEELKRELIGKVYNLIKPHSRLSLFYNCMNEELKFKLISLFLSERKVTKNDWINIAKERQFRNTDILVGLIILICGLFSITSYSYFIYTILNCTFGYSIFFNSSHINGININFLLIFVFISILLTLSLLIPLKITKKDINRPEFLFGPVSIAGFLFPFYNDRNYFSLDLNFDIVTAVWSIVCSYYLIKFMNEMFFFSYFNAISLYFIILIVLNLISVSMYMIEEENNPTDILRSIIYSYPKYQKYFSSHKNRFLYEDTLF